MQRIQPGPGQESVWDYPRPPRLERTTKRLRVVFAGTLIAETSAAYRMLETSHPPVYYFPPEAVRTEYLIPAKKRSYCEFKGAPSYYSVLAGERISLDAAWSYGATRGPYRDISGYIAFYAGRVDACYVDDEKVQAQPGNFYGGWITSDLAGPFKGPPGTECW